MMLKDSINGDLDLNLQYTLFLLIPITFHAQNVNGPLHFWSFPNYSFYLIYEIDKNNFSSSNVFASLILLTMWHTKHPGHGTKISWHFLFLVWGSSNMIFQLYLSLPESYFNFMFNVFIVWSYRFMWLVLLLVVWSQLRCSFCFDFFALLTMVMK